MVYDELKALLHKTNSNEVLGHKPGTLVVVAHKEGGGFAGAPQVLTLNVLTEDEGYERAVFPDPRSSVEYLIVD